MMLDPLCSINGEGRTCKKARLGASVLIALSLLIPLFIPAFADALEGSAALEGRSSTLYPEISEHLEEEADRSIIGSDDAVNPIARFIAGIFDRDHMRPVDEALYVRYTLADGEFVREDMEIDDLFRSEESIVRSIMGQFDTVSRIYDPGSDSEYYVSLLDTTALSGAAVTIDVDFAKLSDLGETVEGCIFDPETGIAYIPKKLYEEDGAGDGWTLQAQVLLSFDTSHMEDLQTGVDTTVSWGSGSFSTPVWASPFSTTTKIDLTCCPDYRDLDISDISLKVNDFDGSQIKPGKNAVYDSDSGVLEIATSPLLLLSVDVSIGDKAAIASEKAYAYELGSMNILPVTLNDFNTDLPIGSYFQGHCWVHYQYDDIPMYDQIAKRIDPYRAINSNLDLVWAYNLIRNGGTWDKDIVYADTHGISIFFMTLPSMKWNEYRLGPLDFTEYHEQLVEGGVLPLTCGHIGESALDRGIGGDRNLDGDITCGSRILAYDRAPDGRETVTIGFITANVNVQSGVGVYRFYVQSTGELEFVKSSGNTDVTAGNPCYSLEGAVYGVYSDASCTQRVGSFTTAPDGNGGKTELKSGDYYVKEESAPVGYRRDAEIHKVTVKPGEKTTLRVTDVPLTDRKFLEISKYDTERSWTSSNKPQGDAQLEGAEYTVEYYAGHFAAADVARASGAPKRTWTFKTDADGCVDLSDAARYLVSGKLYEQDGIAVFPLGTYLIRESKAPQGYLLSETEYCIDIAQEGDSIRLTGNLYADGSEIHVKDGEKVVRGGVSVKKHDSETRLQTPQGDATLQGVKFEIRNLSEGSVRVGAEEHAKGDVVCTIATDQSGNASTAADALPYGRYSIQEVSPSIGYLLTDGKAREFTISTNGAIVEIPASEQFFNRVIRGGIEVQKRDIESGLGSPLGAATLAGVEFEIRNASTHSVRVDGRDFATGEVVKTIATGIDGKASTASDCLPYGTYSIKETRESVGYRLTDDVPRTFEIRDEGKIVTVTSRPNDWANQVFRGDIEFVKVNGRDMSRLAGVPFELTSETTGESHIVVTDANGYASTSASWNSHTHNTNSNDRASEDSYDDEAGIWFGLTREGWSVDPDDSLGALPYDRYTLSELPCDANAGLELVRLEHISVKRDNVAISLGTIDDHAPDGSEPFIHTNASDAETGLMYMPADTDAVINDRVEFMNLDTAKTYTLRATLVYADNGTEVEGSQVSKDFIPEAANGHVNIGIPVDLHTAGGRSVVVYEQLFDNDEKVAEHTDITDNGQTIKILEPSIGTCATDPADGDHVATLSPYTSIADRVEYRNLVPGARYTLLGMLMYKVASSEEEGAILAEPVIDSDGNPVSAVMEFIPEEPYGFVEMQLLFDSTGLPDGCELVVFEFLSRDGIEVAEHADPSDEGQTITVARPAIHTTASDAKSGLKEVAPDEKAEIRDTVSYTGLTPGKTYEMRCRLVIVPPSPDDDAVDTEASEPSEGMPSQEENISASTEHTENIEADSSAPTLPEGAYFLCDADGEPIEYSVEFIPEHSDGEVDVLFKLDAAALAGAKAVAFERLYEEDALIASHEDVEDEEQSVTVAIPSIEDDGEIVEDEPHAQVLLRQISEAAFAKTGDGIALAAAALSTVAAILAALLLNHRRRMRRNR